MLPRQRQLQGVVAVVAKEAQGVRRFPGYIMNQSEVVRLEPIRSSKICIYIRTNQKLQRDRGPIRSSKICIYNGPIRSYREIVDPSEVVRYVYIMDPSEVTERSWTHQKW